MVAYMPALFAYAPPWAWASACGGLALIYFLAWPRRKAAGLPRGPRYFAVRWFHGLVWVLLGLSLALHAVRDEGDLARTAAKVIAVLALVVYAVFVFSAYGPRRSEPKSESEAGSASGDDGVTGPRAR
jgi:hypothetical protein